MKKEILIITNNFEFRTLIESFLSRNFNVKMSPDGEEAIHIIENGYIPELIICESSMLLSGRKISCISLEKDTLYKHIPMLVLSEKEKCFSEKTISIDFLRKPFCLRDLETRIMNLIKKSEKIECPNI